MSPEQEEMKSGNVISGNGAGLTI